MSKASKIEQIRELLIKDDRPRTKVFWPDEYNPGRFLHNGISLTKEECKQIAFKLGIFVIRTTVSK